MFLNRFDAHLTGNQESWTFVGVPGWKETPAGILYPPVWSYPDFDPDPDPSRVPNLYAHELAREDYAFLSIRPLDDIDVSVDYKCPYGSVIHGGIAFRALDSVRCYVLNMTDLGRKAQAYELTLWVQLDSGIRRQLAGVRLPHSVVPDRIVQNGPASRADWEHSSPDWVRVRVQASGTFIRVSMDDRIAFELRDDTYPSGCVGLVARGSVFFRDLQVEGVPATLTSPWTAHEGERPQFFYPGGEQPRGFNAYPVVCRTGDRLLVAWEHDPAPGRGRPLIVLTHSEDGGKSWSRPETIFSRPASSCFPSSLFAHRDGSLSCLVGYVPEARTSSMTLLLRSEDGGRTWSEGDEFAAGGRPLSAWRNVHLYSPMRRLSDGSVVMSGYEADDSRGHANAVRRDRALLFRSEDDGVSWNEPVYFDPENFDHNECMVAEVAPGRLVAFMRTLRETCMWTSHSEDGGRTWSPLIQSDISAECPWLLGHSSGALVLASRGEGTFLRLSFDQGQTWGPTFRLSPASAMIGMTEMGDGRVLVVMHEGYRNPGHIRGQFFRVTPEGPVAV